MPELAEVAIMAEFITKISKNVTFDKLEKSPESKVETDLTLFGEDFFDVSAKSRGKELLVTFTKVGKSESHSLLMSMGMSGNWTMSKEKDGKIALPKHAHLRLFGTHNGLKQRVALCMVDTRRFAKWTWKSDFSSNRGPCPVKEYPFFWANIITKLKYGPTQEKKLSSAPALDIIMNQSLFNGIGNYLRAEIFNVADVNPFKSFERYTPEETERVLKLCAALPIEAMHLGGGAIKDWAGENSSKARFAEWLTCYLKMSSLIDTGKRRFWYNPKWESSEEFLLYVYGKRKEIEGLLKEKALTQAEKNKKVKAQMYEEASALRDKEREIETLIVETLRALHTIEKTKKWQAEKSSK